MNKVINGRRYDTDTAREVGYATYSNPGDFNHWSETLYRKSTGEYFLYGEGGPMSRYATAIGQNQWSGGERIMPLTLGEAQKWAEQHLSADEYEKIFGAINEHDKKRLASFYLPEAAIEKIARSAASQGISKSEVIERLAENLDT